MLRVGAAASLLRRRCGAAAVGAAAVGAAAGEALPSEPLPARPLPAEPLPGGPAAGIGDVAVARRVDRQRAFRASAAITTTRIASTPAIVAADSVRFRPDRVAPRSAQRSPEGTRSLASARTCVEHDGHRTKSRTTIAPLSPGSCRGKRQIGRSTCTCDLPQVDLQHLVAAPPVHQPQSRPCCYRSHNPRDRCRGAPYARHEHRAGGPAGRARFDPRHGARDRRDRRARDCI